MDQPRRIAIPLALLAGILLAGTAACSPAAPADAPTRAASSPSSTPAPTSDRTVLAQAARAAGTPVRSGEVTLTAAAAATQPAVDVREDGSVTVTIGFAAAAAAPGTGTGTTARRVAGVLAAPSGMRFQVRDDRSVAVVGSAGAVVGALPAVVAVDGARTWLGARLEIPADDDGLLDVLVDAGPAGVATLTFGATPLVSATWGEREGGRSLAVVPAAWVRSGSLAAQDALWASVIAAEPDADSVTMHDQMACHALGAPDKASWNLEPWRPEVDSVTMLTSRCNP